jgi:hypothetical protein
MTECMDSEWKAGPMEQGLKVASSTVKNKELGLSGGKTDQFTLENSFKTNCMAEEFTNGRMAGSSRESGAITRFTGKELTGGQMARNTSESTKRTEKVDSASLHFLTGEYIEASGITASRMGKEL